MSLVSPKSISISNWKEHRKKLFTNIFIIWCPCSRNKWIHNKYVQVRICVRPSFIGIQLNYLKLSWQYIVIYATDYVVPISAWAPSHCIRKVSVFRSIEIQYSQFVAIFDFSYILYFFFHVLRLIVFPYKYIRLIFITHQMRGPKYILRTIMATASLSKWHYCMI